MNEKQSSARAFESSAIAESHFYEAFARLDAELMRDVWLDSESSYCIHPGGEPLVGVQRVIESWRNMFRGARPLALFYKVIRKQASGYMAVHLVEERLSSEDGRRRGLVMASNCYLRTTSGWRLFSHHGSPLVPPDASAHDASARMH
jgi:hypothetical protein